MRKFCDLGIGCDEVGICYAAFQDRPEMCGKMTLWKLGEGHQIMEVLGMTNARIWVVCMNDFPHDRAYDTEEAARKFCEQKNREHREGKSESSFRHFHYHEVEVKHDHE